MHIPCDFLTGILKNTLHLRQFTAHHCSSAYVSEATKADKKVSVNQRAVTDRFIASDSDTHFLSENLTKYQLQGWLFFQADIQYSKNASNQVPIFYYDIGSGFCERHSVQGTVDTHKKTVSAVIQCPGNLNALRFSPLNEPEEFVFKGIKIQKLNKLTSLLKSYYNFESVQRSQGKSRIDSLLSAFKSIFDGRLKHLQDNMHGAQFAKSTLSLKKKYEAWQACNEKPLCATQLNSRLEALKFKPLFSVVVPTYNPSISVLKKAIDSVINQSYQNWELCIADDNSTQKEVRELLTDYIQNYHNIRCVFRRENGHISIATNSAIDIANGDFIVFMDHDDLLAPHALLRNAEVINTHPDSKIVYSDEDKIDENGERFDPHFKPQFNRDLLYSQNYISHLSIYKASLVRSVGGLRKGVEGSQDFDLLLRCLTLIEDHQIQHIPEILYHWRAAEGSTALSSGEKDYTSDSGKKALEDHFVSLNAKTSVAKGKLPNTFKVTWPLEKEPLVSLIMPAYNAFHITKKAIDSILTITSYKNFEIILINNNSDEQDSLNYFEEIRNHPQVTVYDYPHPFNYSAINNYGVERARGKVIGLINNDVEVITPGWLTEMTQHVMRKDIGCVGAKLLYADQKNKIQHAGVILGVGGVANHGHLLFDRDDPGYFGRLLVTHNVSAVTGATLLVRKEVCNEVGGLNEKDLQVAFNDVEFCLRVRQRGYRNIWTPFAELYHHESVSRGVDKLHNNIRFREEHDYMMETYSEVLKCDPSYSPNLNQQIADFSINTPL